MKTQIKVLITFAAILVLSFQNCSDMESVQSQKNDSIENGNQQFASCYDSVSRQTVLHGNSVQVYRNTTVGCSQACDDFSNLLIKECINGDFFVNGNLTSANSGFANCTPPSSISCGGVPTSCSVQDPTGAYITAEVGQTARFYRRSTVDCGQSCDSTSEYIIKQCQVNNGIAQFVTIGNVTNPENFRYKSCSAPASSTCFGGGGGSGGSGFQQAGCVVPGAITEGSWSGAYGSWPSYNKNIRWSGSSGTIISLEFTATNSSNEYGTFGVSSYPGHGEESILALSISKTAGCVDRTKLPNNCVVLVSMYGGISWKNGTSSHACNLTPGESYYLNIFWGNTTPHSSGAHCPTGYCGRDAGNIQQ